jgi:hypothetical protein
MALTTFRDTIRRITPKWLQGWLGERLLYSFAVHLDLLGDATSWGLQRRFPGLNGEVEAERYDSLGLIGRERRIRRGPNELNANYAARLIPWLDHHRRRGNPYTMLEQVGAYWSATPFRIDLVYRSGLRFVRDVDGTITRDLVAWNPTDPPNASKWWMFFYDYPGATTDGIWSDPGVWSDGFVWDSNLTPAQVAELRLVPAEWNRAKSNGVIVLLPSSVELWDFPPGLWSDPGDWLDNEAGGVMFNVD